MKQESSNTIAPGAHPFLLTGGQIGVLIVHGYGGTPGDYRPLAEDLHRHGFTVSAMLVAGHGIDATTLGATHLADWEASVRGSIEELRRQCQHVVIVGSSFGGVLATLAADSADALVLVNTPMKYQGGGPFQSVLLRALRLVRSTLPKSGSQAELHERQKATGSLAAWPITGILETKNIISRIFVPRLSSITIPTLIMVNAKDDVVDPESAKKIQANLTQSHTAIAEIPPGKYPHRPYRDSHIAAWMADQIAEFIQRRLADDV